MQEIEPVFSLPWWIPLLLGAASIVAALRYGHIAWFLRKHRDSLVSNPALESAMRHVKPPPYALYALGWLGAAAINLAMAAMLVK